MMVNFFLTKFFVVLPHQKLSWASVSSILLFYHPLSVIQMVPKLPATRSICELPDVQAGFRKGTLSDINHSRILYDPHPRILQTKVKINKWDLMKA